MLEVYFDNYQYIEDYKLKKMVSNMKKIKLSKIVSCILKNMPMLTHDLLT